MRFSGSRPSWNREALCGVDVQGSDAQGSSTSSEIIYPHTADGRYFVVRGRLWRCSNPALPQEQRELWVKRLMRARREKGKAMQAGYAAARERARVAVDQAKQALGERGPVWWLDGAPDWNRHLVVNTPYAEWFAGLGG